MSGAIYHDNTTAWSHINSSAYEVGIAFHVTASVSCTGLQWYRYTTGSGVAPEIVRLWRVSDTTELGRLTSVPDTGAAGWQGANLATPITLVTGQVYISSAYYPGSAGQPSRSDISSTPDVPLVVESNYRRYLAGSAGFPTGADAGSAIGADVLLTALPPPPEPATDADFAKWLSSDSTVNVHQTDLPWRTDANVTALKTLAEGSNGFAAIKGVVDSILTSVGSGLGAAVASIGTTVSSISTSLATHMSIWSTELASTIQSWNDGLVDWFNKMGGTAGGPVGAISGRSGFPTELWTLVDSTDFTHVKSWDVAADLYTLSTASWPINRPMIDVDGAPWRPRNGWWSPRNGDLIGERRFIDWDNNYLEDQGRRMPGIVVWLEGETTGHLEAWLLT